MGVTLLLASALLSGCVCSWTGVDAQSKFTIRSISLTLEPRDNVPRDTNVTLRCSAVVSSQEQPLSREYTIYKDGAIVLSKTTSSTEDLLYPLSHARVSHSGKYKCKISIEGRSLSSEARRLTVTGLSRPILQVERTLLSEAEKLRASCSAPGETGSIIFYFYEDLNEKQDERVNTDSVAVTFPLNGPGNHTIECSYKVLLAEGSIPSEKSSSMQVSVEELSVTPVLNIIPQDKVYEGDQLTVFCGFVDFYNHSNSVEVILSQGTKLLQSSHSQIAHSLTILAEDSAEFECRLDMGTLEKAVTKTVNVTELFSVPTLTMSPAEVFQKEPMKLICKSEKIESERLSKEELTYTLDPPTYHLNMKSNGEFSGKALSVEFNYTCLASAKGIVKHSKVLTVRPKVPVSIPKISIVDKAIISKPFRIRCKSDYGSLPIKYTLLEDYVPVSSVTVWTASEAALFNATVDDPKHIRKFICEAFNGWPQSVLSLRLDGTVIEPVSHPLLTVIPPLAEITEGSNLIFICSIRGTPPVTFKVYRYGNDVPVFDRTSAENNTSFEIHDLGRAHSGMYYFEAFNHANSGFVSSEPVNIDVRLAGWKKILIGGICVLSLIVLVVMCVFYIKSHRGKTEGASELSVKPVRPNSEAPLAVTLTHNSEVSGTPTDAVPGYEGIEGRVANGTRASAALLPANASDGSGYNVSAAV